MLVFVLFIISGCSQKQESAANDDTYTTDAFDEASVVFDSDEGQETLDSDEGRETLDDEGQETLDGGEPSKKTDIDEVQKTVEEAENIPTPSSKSDDMDAEEIPESKPGDLTMEPDDSDEGQLPDSETGTIDPLAVHFIDVGQGDATLITCGTHSMLIDAGNSYAGTTVQLYLHKQNIHTLDYVVWTHPDSDHIGGADVVTTKYEIGRIFYDGEKPETGAYAELADAQWYRGYSGKIPARGETYELGAASITFLSNPELFGGNDASLICIVEHGNNRFLFTGDAEYKAEKELIDSGMNIAADVYQAGHHGSASSTSEEFLDTVNPQYVVISCGKDNSYGHPHEDTLKKLSDRDINIFRTDEQGSIIAVSDGLNITWSTQPTEYVAEEEVGVTEFEYIGNVNNHKLHRSDCNGLPAPHNRVFFDTLAQASEAGFAKDNECHICYPYENGSE